VQGCVGPVNLMVHPRLVLVYKWFGLSLGMVSRRLFNSRVPGVNFSVPCTRTGHASRPARSGMGTMKGRASGRAPAACPVLVLARTPPLTPQAVAPRAWRRVHSHAEPGRPASLRRPASLSTPKLERGDENIQYDCSLGQPRWRKLWCAGRRLSRRLHRGAPRRLSGRHTWQDLGRSSSMAWWHSEVL
jgi:hypothetical protein